MNIKKKEMIKNLIRKEKVKIEAMKKILSH